MISATHTIPMFTYLVDFFIPFDNVYYRMNSVQVMEFNLGVDSQFQILFGRDILCKGIFTLCFDGHFSFSI